MVAEKPTWGAPRIHGELKLIVLLFSSPETKGQTLEDLQRKLVSSVSA